MSTKKFDSKYTLEVCCYGVQDVLNAQAGGAHRVELCSGYEVGGTTPSIGSLILAKSLSTIPVFLMIRPRGGNFVYSALEKKLMLKDVEMALQYKADGIVFGALKNESTIDETFCKELVSITGTIPLTFHRAFDLCSNPEHALDVLASYGVQHILTSGGMIKAVEGIENIRQWQEMSKGKIHIMAGSGVTAENVIQLASTGIHFFHSSCSQIITDAAENERISFNGSLRNNQKPLVSIAKVEALIQKLNDYFLTHE